MDEGIPCTVFRRELEEACIELLAFLSMAGNQSDDVHSKETKLQFMLALHQMFAAQARLREQKRLNQPRRTRRLNQPRRLHQTGRLQQPLRRGTVLCKR